MSISRVPLSILDFATYPAGSSPAAGLRATLDLARTAETLGYARYWLGELHFSRGIASTASDVLLALVSTVTSTIRIGTAITPLGYSSAGQVAQSLGMVATLNPDRVDLGVGRAGYPRGPRQPAAGAAASAGGAEQAEEEIEGVLFPRPSAPLVNPDLMRAYGEVLNARAEDSFEADVTQLLALLSDGYSASNGLTVRPEGLADAGIQVWMHGSSGGQSAQLAARLGMPFGVNYHASPGGTLAAVRAYRDAFVPGVIAEPYTIVSAEVLAADTDRQAGRLAAGYAHWLASIGSKHGTSPYLSDLDAASQPLSEEDRAKTDGLVRTHIFGTPDTVAERLDPLQRATGADELLVTSHAPSHAALKESFAGIAEVWGTGAAMAAAGPHRGPGRPADERSDAQTTPALR